MSETCSREAVRIVSGRDEAANSIFAFLVKRSYRFDKSGGCHRMDNPRPFLETDVYWGEPGASSPRFEADMTPFKAATDVVVIGHAYAPGGVPARLFTAEIAVGNVRKRIAVFGDRIATLQDHGKVPVFSEPLPFKRLPVVFERAYGGVDASTGVEFAYPRNPVGCGLVVRNTPGAEIRLPNFEDPADLLTPDRLVLGDPKRWNRQPLPQAFGWFGKTWYPRMSYVGVIPGFVDAGEAMREEALGLVPLDHIALGRQFRLPSFDVRFGNGASHGLALPYLAGNEQVRLTNLTEDGTTIFRLPGEQPRIVADIGMGEVAPDVVLHSVVVCPDPATVDLVWRGAVIYPGVAWLPHMRRLAGWLE